MIIVFLLLGLICGAGLGVMWSTYQIRKCNEKTGITKMVIDVDEWIKQAKEDKQ